MSYKKAEWIYAQINLNGDCMAYSADDVYDVLLGNITTPKDFVQEVEYWAAEYDEDNRRHNGRQEASHQD